MSLIRLFSCPGRQKGFVRTFKLTSKCLASSYFFLMSANFNVCEGHLVARELWIYFFQFGGGGGSVLQTTRKLRFSSTMDVK